jgi:hypothetical protein
MDVRSRASTFTISIIALLIPLLVVVAVSRAATPYPLPVSNPVDKLGMQEGRWAYNERDYETPYSSAHANNGTADCNWAPNRGFMICDYLNSSPGNGVPSNDLAVFSYNASARTYGRLGIFKDRRSFAEHVTINGNTWTTSGNTPYKGSTLIMHTVHAFSQNGKHANAITKVSVDNGKTWTTISRFTAAKVGP